MDNKDKNTRERKLYKKYIQESSDESSSSSDEKDEVEIQPQFIDFKSSNKEQSSSKEDNKKKNDDTFKYLLSISEKDNNINETQNDISPELMVDDTDNPDDITEYENWKIRELKRIKRQLEESRKKLDEKIEIERRRNLTDEQRKEENLKLGSDDTLRVFRSKLHYLQKYYHKGAFFQDEASGNSEHIYNRDYNLPTWEDKIDRSNLPGIMEKRRGKLFKKGQSKYTHLTNEDTTNFDPLYRIPENIANNLKQKTAGYKSQNKFK